MTLPTTKELTALLGERVEVRLDDTIVVTGKLLAFSDDGECVTEANDGAIWRSWPMLKVVAK